MFYEIFKLFEKLATKIRFFNYLYSFIYVDLIEKEINVAFISSKDKVLHIGCGSCPITSELIVKKTGATVTAIDCDSNAVKIARQHFVNKNISVKVEKANGRDYSYGSFDVIVVSHGVKPKKVILENIFSKMKNGARLIYRNPKGVLGYWYYSEECVFLWDERVIEQKKISFRESVLAIKK